MTLPTLARSDRHEFFWSPVSPPLTVQPGDILQQIGNQLVVTRYGVVIETRDLSGAVPLDPSITDQQTLTNAVFVRFKNMPGQNVGLVRVTENNTTGKVTFHFTNGSSSEIESWTAVGDIADKIDANPTFCEELLMARAYRRSPDGAHKTNMVGGGVTSNLLQDIPVVVTDPE